MTRPTRPLLRWHGGKWLLAPWIISHFPAHRVYVEPFGGAGSVLLRKDRSYAEVYNDMDGEVVNLFRVVQQNGGELVRLLRATPFARREFKLSYEPIDNPVEQARRTVIRSFMGFGSNSHNKATGFRSNSNRSGTTPAKDWQNYPDCLVRVVERLRGVVVEDRDASACCVAHDGPKTLHYLDPPYVFETRDKGTDYRFEMTDAEHARLKETLDGLEGFVCVSGYQSSLYNEVYSDWDCRLRPSYADGARPRVEALWLNPALSKSLGAGLLFGASLPTQGEKG